MSSLLEVDGENAVGVLLSYPEQCVVALLKQTGVVRITDRNRDAVRGLLEREIVRRAEVGHVELVDPDRWNRFGDPVR